jgi:hypothetical protein
MRFDSTGRRPATLAQLASAEAGLELVTRRESSASCDPFSERVSPPTPLILSPTGTP